MRKPDRVAINLHSYLVQKRSLLLWRCATQHIIPLYLFQSPHKRKQIFLISCHCWRTTKRQGQYLPCLRPIKGISWFQFEGWNPTGFVQLQKWLNIIWKDYNKEQIIKKPSGRLKTKTKKKVWQRKWKSNYKFGKRWRPSAVTLFHDSRKGQIIHLVTFRSLSCVSGL